MPIVFNQGGHDVFKLARSVHNNDVFCSRLYEKVNHFCVDCSMKARDVFYA